MQRYKILHRTYYNFSGAVTLGPRFLRLRPREDYDLHIESSTLTITPPATLLWHRDMEGNSVATATFDVSANQLAIESEVVIQQFNEAPLDFSSPITPSITRLPINPMTGSYCCPLWPSRRRKSKSN